MRERRFLLLESVRSLSPVLSSYDIFAINIATTMLQFVYPDSLTSTLLAEPLLSVTDDIRTSQLPFRAHSKLLLPSVPSSDSWSLVIWPTTSAVSACVRVGSAGIGRYSRILTLALRWY